MKLHTPIIACLLAALPAAALANPHGDHSNDSRQTQRAPQARTYTASRSYSPRTEQAPRDRAPQQAARPVYNNAPRYNQSAPRYNDTASRYRAQPVQRYQGRAPVVSERYAARNPSVVARYQSRPAWDWNHGRVWSPSPRYWGGGFWGAFVLGLNFNDGGGYYAVQQGFPGAQLLANYGLQQTDCNQPNLVDIFGPDGSEICAYPNDEVAPGEYQVDPSTLSLVSN